MGDVGAAFGRGAQENLAVAREEGSALFRRFVPEEEFDAIAVPGMGERFVGAERGGVADGDEQVEMGVIPRDLEGGVEGGVVRAGDDPVGGK